MITLFATSSDGWAMARDKSSRWLVRPPYRQANRYRLSAKQAARMLMEEDFDLVDEEFQGWGELCRELERRRVAAATPEELEAAKDAPKRLLKRANPRQASRHLDRIQSELELGNVKRSRDALKALLRAPAVKADPDLYDRALRLLDDADRPRTLFASEDRPRWNSDPTERKVAVQGGWSPSNVFFGGAR